MNHTPHHPDTQTVPMPNMSTPADQSPQLPAAPDTTRSYTLRIPRPNWQVTALVLIALVAAFQSWQLTQLKGSVTAKTTAAAPSASTATAAAGSDSSGLQSQVGGC